MGKQLLQHPLPRHQVIIEKETGEKWVITVIEALPRQTSTSTFNSCDPDDEWKRIIEQAISGSTEPQSGVTVATNHETVYIYGCTTPKNDDERVVFENQIGSVFAIP